MKHEQTPEGATEYADSVDRQRHAAFSAIQARRFAAAFPTVEAREAYLVSRIERWTALNDYHLDFPAA